MSKHTPGPWVGTDYDANFISIDAANGEQVGEAYSPADARLMVAAPELLESLKDVMEYIGVYAHPDDLGVNSEVFRRACVVIAKAEGADNE